MNSSFVPEVSFGFRLPLAIWASLGAISGTLLATSDAKAVLAAASASSSFCWTSGSSSGDSARRRLPWGTTSMGESTRASSASCWDILASCFPVSFGCACGVVTAVVAVSVSSVSTELGDRSFMTRGEAEYGCVGRDFRGDRLPQCLTSRSRISRSSRSEETSLIKLRRYTVSSFSCPRSLSCSAKTFRSCNVKCLLSDSRSLFCSPSIWTSSSLSSSSSFALAAASTDLRLASVATRASRSRRSKAWYSSWLTGF
mmetsp:Transcript_68440/g.123333  ORF Transcript_68440/g.123333 Transcript_68440/m.123333 type:complete len:256 (+) Transcript_68440:633-1400(+)